MMTRFVMVIAFLALSACVRHEYGFERIEGTTSTPLPLKFVSLIGVRDGERVEADLRFAGENDSAQIHIALHLGPPAQFTSGSYRLTLRGDAHEGTITCDSLTYLGGQGDVPSAGGVFILHDAQNRPAYRVTMPPTRIERRVRF